jgi:hypothetical protein
MEFGKPHKTESARKFERVSVDVSVQITTDTGTISFGRTHDVSCRGMSLYLALDLEIGVPIRLKFTLPNSRVALNLDAMIKNRVGFRYGIEFVNATTAEIDEISRVVGILALTQQ